MADAHTDLKAALDVVAEQQTSFHARITAPREAVEAAAALEYGESTRINGIDTGTREGEAAYVGAKLAQYAAQLSADAARIEQAEAEARAELARRIEAAKHLPTETAALGDKPRPDVRLLARLVDAQDLDRVLDALDGQPAREWLRWYEQTGDTDAPAGVRWMEDRVLSNTATFRPSSDKADVTAVTTLRERIETRRQARVPLELAVLDAHARALFGTVTGPELRRQARDGRTPFHVAASGRGR